MFVTIWQRKETACYQKKRPQEKSYNQQRNELRHFALKGLFDVLPTSKGKNIAFPPHPLHAMLHRCLSYL